MRKLPPLACYACRGHGCAQCQQTGLACPACHGRRLRYGRVCAVCCEGNQVHPLRERRAIRAELVRMAAIQRTHIGQALWTALRQECTDASTRADRPIRIAG